MTPKTTSEALERARKSIRGLYGADAVAMNVGVVCELIALAEAALSHHPAPVGAEPALTDDQIERHTLEAGECPPQSKVLLVSAVRRLMKKNGETDDTNRNGLGLRPDGKVDSAKPAGEPCEAGYCQSCESVVTEPCGRNCPLAAAPAPAEPAAPVLTAFDKAVADELPRISHVEYDSHEICKHFAGKVRERIAATNPEPASEDPSHD